MEIERCRQPSKNRQRRRPDVAAGAGGNGGADQSTQTCDTQREGGTLDVGHWMTDGAPSNGAAF